MSLKNENLSSTGMAVRVKRSNTIINKFLLKTEEYGARKRAGWSKK